MCSRTGFIPLRRTRAPGGRRKQRSGASARPWSACLHPIMSFTCEEVWQYLPALPDRLSSVHLANFPGASDILGGAAAVGGRHAGGGLEDSAGGSYRSAESAGRGPPEQTYRRRQPGGASHCHRCRACILGVCRVTRTGCAICSSFRQSRLSRVLQEMALAG